MHRSLFHILSIALFTAGCTADWIIPEDYYVECESNADCPDTAECMLTDDGTARVCVTDGRTECGNGVQEAGETCDDGDDNTLEYGLAGRCNPSCDGYAPHCGDGAVNGDESCDQGAANTNAYGAEGSCNLECSGLAPHCGDGIQNGGEACDAGAANTDAYGLPGRCNASCNGEAPSCGDGVTNASEICDDGANNTNDYSANITCNTACNGYALYCGDGFINGDEDCDDGNQEDDGNGCSADCARCTSPEQCPQSGAVACGDNVVHTAFETCDDGNTVTELCAYDDTTDDEPYPGCFVCDATCSLEQIEDVPRCGDGMVQNAGGDNGKEACDGNMPCNDLHATFTSGTAICGDDCQTIDFSSCVGLPVDMVLVPQGFFWMGCNSEVDDECGGNEYPYHEVYLDSFLIDRTEVTAGAYKVCVDAGDCTYGGSTSSSYRTYNNDRDNHPINYVNHTEAKTYCEAQGKKLPTEAEWEKAARGTDGRKYTWGNEVPTCDLAWFSGCPGDTQPVESLSAGASPYGAMDMAGNFFEWTADWYDGGYYGQTPVEGWVNPEGPLSGVYRVSRGGSWSSSLPACLRASCRYSYSPAFRLIFIGFRCSQ